MTIGFRTRMQRLRQGAWLQTLAFTICALAVSTAGHAQSEIRFDPDLMGGFEWRNIGPNRGGRSLSCTGMSRVANSVGTS